MTIICALHEPGVGTWIGSDTESRGSLGERWPCGPKFELAHGLAVGTAGDHRIACLIGHHIDSLLVDLTSPNDFTTRLIDTIFARYDIKSTAVEGSPNCGSSFVLAGPNGAWMIDRRLGWTAVPGGLVAAGCGTPEARGAAIAAGMFGATSEQTVRAAVMAAIALDSKCGGTPFIHLLPEA